MLWVAVKLDVIEPIEPADEDDPASRMLVVNIYINGQDSDSEEIARQIAAHLGIHDVSSN